MTLCLSPVLLYPPAQYDLRFQTAELRESFCEMIYTVAMRVDDDSDDGEYETGAFPVARGASPSTAFAPPGVDTALPSSPLSTGEAPAARRRSTLRRVSVSSTGTDGGGVAADELRDLHKMVRGMRNQMSGMQKAVRRTRCVLLEPLMWLTSWNCACVFGCWLHHIVVALWSPASCLQYGARPVVPRKLLPRRLGTFLCVFHCRGR